MSDAARFAALENSLYERAQAEATAKFQAEIDAKTKELEAASTRFAEVQKSLDHATSTLTTERETRAALDDRVTRAERQLKNLEDTSWVEMLVLVGCGVVGGVAGFYLQRKTDWIPWVAIAGAFSVGLGIWDKRFDTQTRYVMVGGGAGLIVGSVAFTIMNAFPDLIKKE